jgi:DNA polymerase III subunit gamma/tau
MTDPDPRPLARTDFPALHWTAGEPFGDGDRAAPGRSVERDRTPGRSTGPGGLGSDGRGGPAPAAVDGTGRELGSDGRGGPTPAAIDGTGWELRSDGRGGPAPAAVEGAGQGLGSDGWSGPAPAAAGPAGVVAGLDRSSPGRGRRGVPR